MKLYSQAKDYILYNGKMQDMETVIPDNSIDSIVCDPPYHLKSIQERFGKENSKEAQYGKDGSFQRLSRGFMGKTWDGGDTAFLPETWKHCFNVLKPGGYLLAFGGSRTFHRIACAIEDAGFEIRDCIMWLYGSGFPKSMSLSKGIEAKEKLGNAGTRNKRKIEQSCEGEAYTLKQTNNGAMGEVIETTRKDYVPDTELAKQWEGWGTCLKPAFEPIIIARKPFKGSLVDNVLEYGVGGLNIDECRVGEDVHKVNINDFSNQHGNKFGNGEPIAKLGEKEVIGRFPANVILSYDESDYGEWARYFYCAKASKKDRDEGLEDFEESQVTDGNIRENSETARAFGANSVPRKNIHPTVKPTQLMQYLVRLVTPKGGTVLDCFMGSGSTGKAVMFENKERNANYKFIGIEMTDEYLPICEARIKWANSQQQDYNLFNMGEINNE